MADEHGITYTAWLRRYKKLTKWPQALTIVGCLWEDAAHAEDSENASTIMSLICGTVVESNPKELKIAFEAHDDHGSRSTRDVTTIPASLVRRMYQFGHVDFK